MPAPTASPASSDRNVDQIAAALRVSIGLLVRRLRQVPVEGDLTLSETSALARLDRGGPSTPGALARQEQISPQSMGATLAALESRGLIARSPDPEDGRRAVMSITDAGLALLRSRRDAKAQQLARALSAEFSAPELDRLASIAPLLERLAQSI
jgi:DNA-binding MarR family transcriptional regulator